MWTCLLYVLTSIVLVNSGPRYSSRIVDTQSGAIRGIIHELNSRHLEPVELFLGVPYAAAPARLTPPTPAPPWAGTRLADSLPPVCPQRYPDISNMTAALQRMPKDRYMLLRRLVPLLANMSEDCLNLNIYVPASGNRGVDAPYAVIVYVHGESYEWNSGNVYDGSVLASHGHVIVVTLNYRLGLLGFLKPHSGSHAGDCCVALRDIEAALKWLQLNIASFGGDPGRVTVVGHDTGAALVNLLLLQESNKGLLHKAVLLSGSMLSPWALVPSPDSTRSQVTTYLGCPDKHDLPACIKDLPLSKLLAVDFPAPRFLPRFGPWSVNSPSYTMEHAGDMFMSTPLLLGVTTTESYLDMNEHDIQYGFEEDQRNRILRTYVRNAYVYHLNEIFSTVRNEYTDWDKPIVHPINVRDSVLEALSDGHTVSQLLKMATLHAKRGKASTHMFHFNYQPKDSDFHERLGSVRGEDLSFVLGQPLVGGHPYFPHNYSRQDMSVSETLVNFVTNFAKTSNPNEPRHHHTSSKDKSHHRGLTWEPYDLNTQLYLSLGVKSRMKSHYRGHKMAIWLNLIPQLHQSGDQDVSMRHHHFHERENHYYAGSIRAEAMTRIPEPVSLTTPVTAPVVECEHNMTSTEAEPQPSREEEQEALRHYTGFTAALGVTVGVGCLLLLLNLLLFAGIFYQRDRQKKSKQSREELEDVISLDTFSKKSPTIPDPPPPPRHPPVPPTRTSSNPSGTVKKRVQIQEISV
ncbi:neuroligin-1-like [Macrosteles quadrilineatus]|uniref:neuroligin-1-like n=1 Tax=Macrosteles quadrilineatus TaxID=74068 RepID=UPI0023E306B1|nr:neuroligin-1-like [Macrosteles quadrilineatus]